MHALRLGAALLWVIPGVHPGRECHFTTPRLRSTMLVASLTTSSTAPSPSLTGAPTGCPPLSRPAALSPPSSVTYNATPSPPAQPHSPPTTNGCSPPLKMLRSKLGDEKGEHAGLHQRWFQPPPILTLGCLWILSSIKCTPS